MFETETIGKFTFNVAFREPSPEAKSRFEQRVDALTAWLLSRWRKREEANDAERPSD